MPVEQQNGVLVAFSTEPGKTARDTGAASGPYAAALARSLSSQYYDTEKSRDEPHLPPTQLNRPRGPSNTVRKVSKSLVAHV